MASLGKQYLANGFEPITYQGELVYPNFSADMAVGDRVRTTWLSAASPRVQGLSLSLRIPDIGGAKGRGGLLRIEETEAPTIGYWMDTAPRVVEAECVKLKSGAELWISNRWRTDDGVEHEWLNNFGIKIEPITEDSVILHCSDGYGEPSFDDQVVRVDLIRN
ncbi:MAG: hypothetical protein J2O48_09455 [Solirubrobacterales bacterium]|nr:hypothetical protein [Solirubrobacterales bacterium]